MKRMKYLIAAAFAVMLLSGCETKIQKVYVDANGTEITSYKEFKTLKAEIVCDDRGYAYYLSSMGWNSITPVLENSTYGTSQVRCETLK